VEQVVNAGERGKTALGLPEGVTGSRVRLRACLQEEDRGGDLKAVLHPVIDLLQQHLTVVEGPLQALRPLAHAPFQLRVRAPQVLFRRAQVRDVEVGREVLDEPAISIADWCDEHGGAEGRAVLTVQLRFAALEQWQQATAAA
jgi:hypothetical protein